MTDPWNDSKIQPPPIHTALCMKNIDYTTLSTACKNIIRVLRRQSPMHQESAVLSRFIYKFDKKFRNDIGYRNLRKVNSALRKYLMINFLKDVDNFMSTLPSIDEDPYLPTRQMLEYVLVRLITFAKIMLRICVCSKQAAIFYLHRVKRGESHWMSLMPYALLSRINSMSKLLLQHSCIWYSHLYPFLNKLQIEGLPFLSHDIKLPIDIETWLDIKSLDDHGKFNWTQKKCLTIDPNLIDNEETDTIDDVILKYVSKIDAHENDECAIFENKIVSSESLMNSAKVIDHGEAISRESFKALFKSKVGDKNVKTVKSNTHSADQISNSKKLSQFIDKEEEFRNNSSDKCLTKHLSFMQWQALKNSLQKLIDPLNNNRKIERKFQKLWKEKCLDYC